MLRLSMVAGLALIPLAALAQRPEGPPDRPFGPPPDGAFFGEVMGRPGERVVKGAPFKATATTESTQALADGNTIVRKDSALTYRDAEGRTRREMALPARPGTPATAAKTLVFVDDPVAGTGFVLEPDTHTARQRPERGMRAMHEGGPGAPDGSGAPGRPGRPGGDDVAERPEGGRPRPDDGGRPGFGVRGFGPPPEGAAFKPEETALGTRTIEGVEAAGTRSVVTIPAGAIGNTKAIRIVSERWYAPELKAVVLSTLSDPRFGTRTFRLSGIARGDVDKALFEVPADYTLTEGPPHGRGPRPGGLRPGTPQGERQ